jgi:glycosyltransferase involved in cell wall biosynthesis
MNVLALASYPVEAAATRYRLKQFVEPLAARGIDLEIRPFTNAELFRSLYQQGSLARNAAGLFVAGLKRIADLPAVRKADVILIQREAMNFGPPAVEWSAKRLFHRPILLDLDDATYVPYNSPTYGSMGRIFKWFSKTDDLIGWADVVTCGNRGIADYVASQGAKARILATVVDTDVFKPQPRENSRIVIGWVGTHSTLPYLKTIFPVLTSLAKHYDFRLRVVGAGSDVIVPGVEVENLPWQLDREVEDFQSIDIGVYPIDESLYGGRWAHGKSGFKAVQYMAVGVPYVATPVGGSSEIGEQGITHFFAANPDEWYSALEILLRDQNRRLEMGRRGREHALEHYTIDAHADILADALNECLHR